MSTVNRMSAFSVDESNLNVCYFIAGKAILRNGVTNGEVVGYVVEEDNQKMKIQIDNEMNETIEMARPVYNNEEGIHVYSNSATDLYKWIEYHPIRFKIFKRGMIQFTINRIHINKDENIIINI